MLHNNWINYQTPAHDVRCIKVVFHGLDVKWYRWAGIADLRDTRNFQTLILVPVEVTLFKMKIKMDPKLTEEDFTHSNNIHDIVLLIFSIWCLWIKTVELMPHEGTQNLLNSQLFLRHVPANWSTGRMNNTFRGSWLPSATGTSGWPAFSHCQSVLDKAELVRRNKVEKERLPWECVLLLTRIKALRVACSVVQLPKMVVTPSTWTAGDWNAIIIAMLSSGIRAWIH